MCLICIDIIREKLTAAEAFRNLRELWEKLEEEEHLEEVFIKVIDLEQKELIEKYLENEKNN
jgi:hypothetical protein